MLEMALGSLVRLNLGGPLMTAVEFQQESGQFTGMVECLIGGDGAPHRDSLPQRALGVDADGRVRQASGKDGCEDEAGPRRGCGEGSLGAPLRRGFCYSAADAASRVRLAGYFLLVMQLRICNWSIRQGFPEPGGDDTRASIRPSAIRPPACLSHVATGPRANGPCKWPGNLFSLEVFIIVALKRAPATRGAHWSVLAEERAS